LSKQDAAELVTKSYSFPMPAWPMDPVVPFGPTVEKSNGVVEDNQVFLPNHPETLFQEGKFQKVPFFVGVTKHEGLLIHAAPIIANENLTKALNEQWNEIIPITLVFEGKIPKSKWDEASEAVRVFYFGSKTGRIEDNHVGLEQMYSDRFFVHGVRSTILYMANETNVYPYVFDYTTTDSGFQTFFPQQDYLGKTFHADDALYAFSGLVFGTQLNPNNTEAHDFSRKYVKLLVSFAINGVPSTSEKWPATNAIEGTTSEKPLQWFHIGKNPGLQDESFGDRAKFWDALFKKYGGV